MSTPTKTLPPRKKLIEVALPLEAINRESAREKSIRHGHPSTLHLWWARRPLAACRAVLFSSLVDDPSSDPQFRKADGTVDEERAASKRAELFNLIEELVKWENSNNPVVIDAARAEIARCVASRKIETGELSKETVVWVGQDGRTSIAKGTKHPQGPLPREQGILTAYEVSLGGGISRPARPEAINAFLAEFAPPVLDPFCGGGSIPLEAQRLGLRSFGSDLNPVPVLITKALIEIPPKFANMPPVNPESRGIAVKGTSDAKGKIKKKETQGQLGTQSWKGAAGLAEDVRYYGRWMRDEAQKRIGHLYPKITVTEAMARDRKDLKDYIGQELTVIAWLWARTVPSPNPAAGGAHVPLVRSFWLSTKEGKKAWVEPVIAADGKSYKFEVRAGTPKDFDPGKGTMISRKGGICVLTQTPMPFEHIRAEATAGRMGARLMAIVAEGTRGRVYLSPTPEHEKAAEIALPKNIPDTPIPEQALGFSVQNYGMDKHYKLFTNRQLAALTTFSDLVMEARARVLADARASGLGGSAEVAGAESARFQAVGSPLPPTGNTLRADGSTLQTSRNALQPAGSTFQASGNVLQTSRSALQTRRMEADSLHGAPGTAHGAEDFVHGAPARGHGGQSAVPGSPAAAHGGPDTAHGAQSAAHGRAGTIAGGPDTNAGGAATDPAADSALPNAVAADPAADYADAVATYLAFALDKGANLWSSLASWMSDRGAMRETFARQTLSMAWDFAETSPFSASGGNFDLFLERVTDCISHLPAAPDGFVVQRDATTAIGALAGVGISTDPPYYDNIGYADLSDFFYVWLRRSLSGAYPALFRTLLTPKTEELIATPFRHGGSRDKAMSFFESALGRAFERMREVEHSDYPLTVYYAFKQSETKEDEGDEESTGAATASSGWETMLEGLIHAGFCITGTWPMQTEGAGRMRGQGSNALASSIVLVCHPRGDAAPMASRREFVTALKRELPAALRDLQSGNIAPVDLAQAAIGPGMAVFSRYAKVLETSGDRMGVRTALALINQVLDEVLAEQEGEYDADTRWCIKWFEQYAHSDGPYGDAETLCKAMAVGVNGLVETGVVAAKSGKVRLFKRAELMGGKPDMWDPAKDNDILHWEVCQYLSWALESGGEERAADLLRRINAVYAGATEVARDLAYRLYTVCERKKWAQEAISYNALIVAWPEIQKLAAKAPPVRDEERTLYS
ncbi:MAG: DUF1156 domain-containing protein [Phycisphaerales bacterium]